MGDDIAAFQLEWMHIEEAKTDHAIRYFAMDSLTRDLKLHLPNGWKHGSYNDFDTSSAYADWIVRLEQKGSTIKSKGKDVWLALEGLHPHKGWMPVGPHDILINESFLIGWPER